MFALVIFVYDLITLIPVFTFSVIFMCDTELRPFLRRVCVMGMCNGEYLFLYVSVEKSVNYDWNLGEPDDELVKEAYKYLIMARNNIKSI